MPTRPTFLPALLGAALLGLALLPGAAPRAQELTIGLRAGPVALDPHAAAAPGHLAALRNIFDTLVRRSPRMELVPGLAESWQRLDDTTWEFRLRRGVLWHDGTPFTAADVTHSIERVPGVGTADRGLANHVAGILAMVVLDEHTIRFRTDDVSTNLPLELARIFIVQSAPNPTLAGGDSAVGTGPYRYVEWTPGAELVLERNAESWEEEKPAFARVVLREIPDDAARAQALLDGSVDLIEAVPLTALPALRRAPDIRLVHGPSPQVLVLHPDAREVTPLATDPDGGPLARNPFRDARVRRAASLALDRAALARGVLEGLAVPARAPLPMGFLGVPPDLPELPHDPAAARRLLAEAGFPRGFRVQLHCVTDRFAGEAALCAELTRALGQVGIAATMVPLPAADYFPRFIQGDFSLALNGWGTPTGEATSLLAALLHGRGTLPGFGTLNGMRYGNAELDRLTRASLETADETARRGLLEQALRIAVEDYAVIPVVALHAAWALDARRIAFTPRMDEETLAISVRPAAPR